MPAYTLGEIMSQATARVGRRADLDASTVSFLANEAALEVHAIYPVASSESSTMLSVVSGSPSLALPAGCETLTMLSLQSGGSGSTLLRTSFEEIDSYGTAGGTPTRFAYQGDTLELRPVPNSNWSALARFRVAYQDMTATGDVPSLATPWRAAVVMKLEEKLHLFLGNGVGAAMAQQRYLGYVSMLRNDDARRQSSELVRGVRVLYDG